MWPETKLLSLLIIVYAKQVSSINMLIYVIIVHSKYIERKAALVSIIVHCENISNEIKTENFLRIEKIDKHKKAFSSLNSCLNRCSLEKNIANMWYSRMQTTTVIKR